MSKTVEFWYDVMSPAAYLAYWELKNIVQRTDAIVDYQPMLLFGVFKATGNQTPINIAPKGKWMLFDMANYARKYGIPLKMNPFFIFNSMPLMRGAIIAQQRHELELYNDTIFNGIWRQEKNLGDPEVIAQTLTTAGLDATAYVEGVQQQEVKDALILNTNLAVEKGVFGAPTFFVGEKMWWGQDRLDWVEQELAV
ncbi:MAG: 2-hydroxychromene-2-carboxylate isomerase [Rhodospirillaceae bacterium]|nr:2-hydroxychromene-2-carboxylate isomerase [Rhodospirillaceae bacterium]